LPKLPWLMKLLTLAGSQTKTGRPVRLELGELYARA
jgi:hypothetical protein